MRNFYINDLDEILDYIDDEFDDDNDGYDYSSLEDNGAYSSGFTSCISESLADEENLWYDNY